MTTSKPRLRTLAITPLALLVACGGGGGGSDTTGTSTQTQHPATVTNAVLDVPVAGGVVADCTMTGTGVIDSVTNAAAGLVPGSLPVALPKLSAVVAQADLSKIPVLGGLVVNASGKLIPVSINDVTAGLPGGVPSLANLPVPVQLLSICSSLVSALPAGTLTDPTALLGTLGGPNAALGAIPIFNLAHDAVGVILLTVPAGLVPGSGSGATLPGVPTLPDLTKLVPVDTSTLPVGGDTVATLTGTVLGLLNTNGLVSGNLLALVLSLLP